jgi:hypothetical protein
MPLDKPYSDVPGTIIFDAEQARRGYHLNMFCVPEAVWCSIH